MLKEDAENLTTCDNPGGEEGVLLLYERLTKSHAASKMSLVNELVMESIVNIL